MDDGPSLRDSSWEISRSLYVVCGLLIRRFHLACVIDLNVARAFCILYFFTECVEGGFHFSTSSLSSLNIFIDYDLELAFFLRMHVLLRGFLGSPIHSSEHVSRTLPS
jgi:hypothetical protein